MVRNDDDTQAFADPLNPDTSACAGPSNAQIVRVDYNAACSDGFTICTLKTTTSVLSGNVTEEEDLDATTLLPVRTKTVGKTHDINGSTITETHSSTRSYDAFGRVTEINGALDEGGQDLALPGDGLATLKSVLKHGMIHEDFTDPDDEPDPEERWVKHTTKECVHCNSEWSDWELE